ncbi:gem-associated protein 2 [Tribolium madens]|uniref:gem-associated protein 2 n=1 Tax=Tribolium madens TaxID=41895 RepID=UPI001CF74D4E|nr:gem-associated protein 2 [Tribolium madens]
MSDYDESFDEDDDDCGILKQALHVEFPENFNPNKVPQTGEEYLQHVIYERRQCKTWLTADIDRSKFLNQQTLKLEVGNRINKGSPLLLPSKKWQTQKIDEFTSFQKFICFKIDKESTVSSFNEETFLNKVLLQDPQFSELAAYTQAAKIRMFQIISKHVNSIPKGESLGKKMGAWIYAILTLLEKPLSPDSCYTLREFAKRCLDLRSNLDEHASEELYMPLNLFICIIARFYNQLDLADPF